MGIKRMILMGLFALAALMLLSACAIGSIQEDNVQLQLPQIDPEEGTSREVKTTLYYRLAEEDYLVGIPSTVNVASGERTEHAIVRELLLPSGALPLGAELLIDSKVDIVDTVLDDGVLYITLSQSFLTDAPVRAAKVEAKKELDAGTITSTQYDERISKAELEQARQRRLCAYAVINSITGYSSDIEVQLLVDSAGTGTGRRLTYDELGLGASDDGVMEFNAQGFLSEAVAGPKEICDAALIRLENDEYEEAYRLFAPSEGDGSDKPTYAEFENSIKRLCGITGHSVNTALLTDGGARVTVQIELELPSASAVSGEATIELIEESGIYGISFTSFMAALKGVLE